MKEDKAVAELLRKLEERLLQSDVRKSPATVGDLLADEFVDFGSSGRVFDKRQVIDALRGETTATERSVLDFRTSVLRPGVVIATYRLARSAGAGGVREYFLRSAIWKLIGDRWQMGFHQGTASRAP